MQCKVWSVAPGPVMRGHGGHSGGLAGGPALYGGLAGGPALYGGLAGGPALYFGCLAGGPALYGGLAGEPALYCGGLGGGPPLDLSHFPADRRGKIFKRLNKTKF